MKVTLKQLEEAIETIQEWTEYDVEVNGPQDYDVVPYISKDKIDDLLEDVDKILSPKKKKWWRIWPFFSKYEF